MPQLANIVLKDGAATPANHTFTPQNIVDGVGVLVETTGVPLADKRLTISCKKTAAGNYKARLQLTNPVVEISVVNGVNVPVITRTAYADVTFNFASTSSEQERKDAISMVADALASSQTLVRDTVQKLQGIY